MHFSWTSDGYWLVRCVFLRGLALVYLIAFLNAVNQFKPLLGEHGLLPVKAWVKAVSFRASPSLFYLAPSDWAFTGAAWLGVLLSAMALVGIPEHSTVFSIAVWGALWVLYLSFVNVGQTFYAFGWESILLEAGFYSIFLSAVSSPQIVLIFLLRWLCFRVMFGAGLIKLRGDPCWRDMTCLHHHYETQPMPNALSWYFHWGPEWTRRGGVWFNHFAELAVPFFYFFPQPVASIAALITIVFQALIMASGNLSWLNLLTIVIAIPALDDRVLGTLLHAGTPVLQPPGPALNVVAVLLVALVIALSVRPVLNMLSPGQVMNASYNPLHLVGTYGAFGGITRVRYEVVVEGTDERYPSQATVWREYEFRGKPNATGRRPPQVAPYHLRLDWLMWFAAMSSYARHPWFVHFMNKLLEGDRQILALLKRNPFPSPPACVRASLYRYEFTNPEERRRTGNWWKRQYVRPYFPEVSLETPGMRRVLQEQGWR